MQFYTPEMLILKCKMILDMLKPSTAGYSLSAGNVIM